MDSRKTARKARKEKLKAYVEEARGAGCAVEECEESSPACMDFHHLSPRNKDNSISRMVSNEVSIPVLQAEMDKCAVVCANCHRKLHAGLIEL